MEFKIRGSRNPTLVSDIFISDDESEAERNEVENRSFETRNLKKPRNESEEVIEIVENDEEKPISKPSTSRKLKNHRIVVDDDEEQPVRGKKIKIIASDSEEEEETDEVNNPTVNREKNSDASQDDDSFIAPEDSDSIEEFIDEDESEESSSDEESDEGLQKPPEELFKRMRERTPQKNWSAQRTESIQNGLFCSLCGIKKAKDSFSARQQKNVDNTSRYCLAHTGTSGFNRPAVTYVAPNTAEIEEADSFADEEIEGRPRYSRKKEKPVKRVLKFTEMEDETEESEDSGSDSQDEEESDHNETTQNSFSSKGLECVICHHNQREYMFTECKHFALCEDCTVQFMNKRLRACPICQTLIATYPTKIYVA